MWFYRLIVSFTCSIVICTTAWGVNSTLKSEKKFSRWAVMPVIARGEETDWQLGALLIHFLPMISTDNKQSRILGAAFYTTRDQDLLSVSPQIYNRDGKYALTGGVTFRYWPALYYGIGNNTKNNAERYEAKQKALNLHVERAFKKHFYSGLGFRLLSESVTFNNKNANISNLIGAEGGAALGISFSLTYDNRDDIDAPYKGYYMTLKSHIYNKLIGSDFDYETYELDLRKYFKTGRKSTLGIAAYLRVTDGDVPFRELSSPDGVLRLRGIENGRYRDKHLLSKQLEYRFPIAARFGGTLFAESAQVNNNMSKFSLPNAKYAIGSGIRWQMIPGRRFNLRADFSYVDSGFGFVINVGEAF